MSAKAALKVKINGQWVAVPMLLAKGAGTSFSTDETLTLDPETMVLSVNTAKVVEPDNTLPVTSAAVHVEVGNINVLLETI